jgi:hypothetical protein
LERPAKVYKMESPAGAGKYFRSFLEKQKGSEQK